MAVFGQQRGRGTGYVDLVSVASSLGGYRVVAQRGGKKQVGDELEMESGLGEYVIRFH